MRRKVKRSFKTDPDTRHDSLLVSKFINYIMLDGKKWAARKIVYTAFDIIKEKEKTDPLVLFETAIKNGDQPDYVYSDLAEIYAKTGNSDRAIEVYRASVERARSAVVENSDPNFKELNEDVLDRAIINLAKELSKNGKFKEAEDQVLSILKRRPQHPEAQYQLGKILKGKG